MSMRIILGLLFLLVAAPLRAQLPPPTTGDLLVSSAQNDRLLRLAFDGTELQALAFPKLSHPRGIVVSMDGTVFLASQNSNEILVLDRSLRLVRRFPTKNVSGPTGAALGPNGHLFVAGFSSNNVGEFKADGTFVRTYSVGGMRGTNCVAFRRDGGFYTASAATNAVLHFKADGTFERSFTGFGLSSPMGIAIWNGEVFVAGGGSSNIVVFDQGGKALRQIRHRDLSGPQGIAFTRDGVLAVSNYYNHTICWFKPDGTHLRTVRPLSSSVPRSLAFLPSVTLEYSGKPVLGVPFPVRVVSPHEPGLVYATALALSSAPGLPLPDGRIFPLTPDPLFFLSLGFPGFVGVLDGNGRATVTLLFPNSPGLRNLPLHCGALTLDPRSAGLFRQVSAPAGWIL